LAKSLVEDFLKSSWSSIETLVKELPKFKDEKRHAFTFFHFRHGQKEEITVDGEHFFLRGSVEYSNPQLTVEDVQGIIATRLLEACGNYFSQYGLHPFDSRDIDMICETLKKSPSGEFIFPFLLNTDETEPDRYSMNPLKESILTSGQSAFPSASVKTEQLKIDANFATKYEGSLICKEEIEVITHYLETCKNSYTDMSDAVKYDQLEKLSTIFGMNLCLAAVRLPLSAMQKETTDGLIHYIIREIHKDYQAVERAYNCMGRSMKNRTTLLTVPHSTKGYGSKRAVRGKIYFDGTKLKSAKVTYQPTPLYPNAIDPQDVSIAQAEDNFIVEGDKFVNYNFKETPSSPQFFLYSLASPENGALWHGIGAFGAAQLLGSYTSIRQACARNAMIKDLKEKYGVSLKAPLQFNLAPQHMWVHPVHRNIDASIGCVKTPGDLVSMGMRVEYLSAYKYD
jgi:hypothetical protein